MLFIFDDKKSFEKFQNSNPSFSFEELNYPIPKKLTKFSHEHIHIFLYELEARGSYHIIQYYESDSNDEVEEAMMFFASILPKVRDLWNQIGDSSAEIVSNYLRNIADIDVNKVVYIDEQEFFHYIAIPFDAMLND